MSNNKGKWLTVAEYCKANKIKNKSTVYYRIKVGKLKSKKIGHLILIKND